MYSIDFFLSDNLPDVCFLEYFWNFTLMARRPGVVQFIWRNFLDSFDRKRFQKTFVGTDEQGNRYYELTKSKKIVNRSVSHGLFLVSGDFNFKVKF